jgi:hypothetical protein
MKTKLKKDLTIEDFQTIQFISWDQIEITMGKRMYKKFTEFMFGQTTPAVYCRKCSELFSPGVYPWDLKNFLRKKDRYFD